MHQSFSELLNLTLSREEFLEKIFDRYVGARSFPFKDFYTMATASRLVISAIVGNFCF